MITLVLIDYDDTAHEDFATSMREQSCQEFEILSAPSYATLGDILNTAYNFGRGHYIWLIDKRHAPAQPQTIQKIKSFLRFNHPDIIVGSFIFTRETKKLFFKQCAPKLFQQLPASCFLLSRDFLDRCAADIIVRDIITHGLKHARIIARAAFPLSVSDDDFYLPPVIMTMRGMGESVLMILNLLRIRPIESA